MSIAASLRTALRAAVPAVAASWRGPAWPAGRSAFCSLSEAIESPSMRIIVCSPSLATALVLGLVFVSKAGKRSSQLQWCGAFALTAIPERRDDLLERLAAANRFAGKIGEFADRPAHPMDAFSQILSGVQLNGAVFFRAEFSAPWGLSTPTSKAMAATAGVGAEHLVVLYHLVIDGAAVIELLDGQRTELNPGDIWE